MVKDISTATPPLPTIILTGHHNHSLYHWLQWFHMVKAITTATPTTAYSHTHWPSQSQSAPLSTMGLPGQGYYRHGHHHCIQWCYLAKSATTSAPTTACNGWAARGCLLSIWLVATEATTCSQRQEGNMTTLALMVQTSNLPQVT